MAKPTNKPYVASVAQNLPNTGQPNKEQPSVTIQNVGYDKGQKPAAEEYNWLFDNVEEWITYLEGETDASLKAANNLSDVINAVTSFTNIKQAASTSVTGVVQTANQTEVNTGTNTLKYITPQTLQQKLVGGTGAGGYASLGASGVIELATQTEVNAGADALRAVTPQTLANWSGLGATNFTYISAVSVYDSTTANDDVNLDLRAYLPNGGEAIFSFDFRGIYNNRSFSWAGISPLNNIPTWSETLHAEMTAVYIDSGSQSSYSAGNLFKISDDGQFRLHKTGSTNHLRVRLIGYRAW